MVSFGGMGRGLLGMGSSIMPGENDWLEEMLRRQSPFPTKPVKPDPYAIPGAAAADDADDTATAGGVLGGGKMTGKDWLGAGLGAIGDAIAQQNGGQAVSTPMFMQGMAARRQAEMASQKAAQIASDLQTQGYSPEQARLMALNPQAIGTNMASHAGAYSLNKGEQRFNNNRVVNERPDQFETPTGDRYNSWADGRTQQVYREEAPVFHGVEGKGLYTLDRHTGADYGDRPVGKLSATPPGGGGQPSAALPSGQPWSALDAPAIDAGQKRREFVAAYGPQDGELIYQEWLKQQKGGR